MGIISSEELIEKLSGGKRSEIDGALARALELLIKELRETKRFSEKRLFAFSMVLQDEFASPFLEYYLAEMKHIGGKYEKRILYALEKVAEASGSERLLDMIKSFNFGGRY